jgi:hypothetical protein
VRYLATSALAVLAGCSPEAVLWIQVTSPLRVPDQTDAARFDVSRASDGTLVFARTYDLTSGPQFPLTLSLTTRHPDDMGVPLEISVDALLQGAFADPWSCATVDATLTAGQTTSADLVMTADAGTRCEESPLDGGFADSGADAGGSDAGQPDGGDGGGLNYAATATGSTLTWTHNVGAGADLVAIVGVNWSPPTMTIPDGGVTFGGNRMTFVGTDSVSDQVMAQYALADPPVGDQTVSVLWTGGTFEGTAGDHGAVAGAVIFAGVDQTSPAGTFSAAHGTSGTTASVTIPSNPGEMVIATLDFDSVGKSLTPGAGEVEQWLGRRPGGGIWGGGSTAPGQPSVLMKWTSSAADNWILGGFSIKAAPDSGVSVQ